MKTICGANPALAAVDPVSAAANHGIEPSRVPEAEPESNGRLRRVNPIKRKQMQQRLTFVEEETSSHRSCHRRH